MRLGLLFFLLLNAGILPLSAQTLSLRDILDHDWTDAKRSCRMRFYESNGYYYGKIVWLAPSAYVGGKPVTDVHNPDPAKRNVSMLGYNIFTGLKWDGQKLRDGKVYESPTGRTWGCNLWLENAKVLNIRGYLGFSLLGKTEQMFRWE